MRITRRALGMVVTGAAVAAVTACSRGPLKVERLQLGRALNSDKSIAIHATRFKPDQTVYVSILTMGAGSGELSVRWTFQGRVISEESRSVSYSSDAATEFHIAYAGGFPTGEYKVEVMVDGQPLETRTFRVEA